MIDSIAIRGLFRNLTFLVVITIAFLALAALPSVSEAQSPPTLTQSLDIKVEDMSITVRYPDKVKRPFNREVIIDMPRAGPSIGVYHTARIVRGGVDTAKLTKEA